MKIQQKNKKFEERFASIEVSTLSDIKKVLDNFRRNNSGKVEFTVSINGDKVNGQSNDASLHDMLITGFDKVKKRKEALSKMVEEYKTAEREGIIEPIDLVNWDIDSLKFDVDNLIRNRLGGKRKGLRIRWDLQEGSFEYDPYTKKVFRVEK